VRLRDLVIIGAGGTSREIADAVDAINRREPIWNLLGFLDDDVAKQGTSVDGIPVLGAIAAEADSDVRFIIGIASWRNPEARRAIVSRLGLPPERYATIIHPSALISSHAVIGVGTAVLQNVVITPGTTVGDHTLILQNVTMAHDQVVEDYVTIASGATVAGLVRLRSGCYLGAGCTIMNGVTVNGGALAAVGAVVMNEVPAGRTVAGNPARLLPDIRRH
jgi:sugar O-acyltransferase (sialic acid O-acetyltransferase NeuD family)